MSDQSDKKVRACPICLESHESMMLFGMEFVPCPEVPENIIIPQATLETFFAGKSMMDHPVIVIT